MAVEDIYGVGKNQLIHRALIDVNKQFNPHGLIIDQLYWGVQHPPAGRDPIANQCTRRERERSAGGSSDRRNGHRQWKCSCGSGRSRGESDADQGVTPSEPTRKSYSRRAIAKWNGELPTYMSGSGNLPFIGNVAK